MSSKYRESRRRCLMCGCSPCMDPNISVFRFPKPGKKNTQRCEQWAHYCFPEREWFSPVFQQQLYSEHKVLCSKHFRKTSFIDYPTSFKSLHRFAIPENEIVVTCEICGITTKEVLNQERLFMAQFPLNEDCCRQWVRLTGKKDLAYVPIEELHSSKHICGQHFRPEDFVKKDILLRKNAVPSIGLTAEPLPEEILKDFPLHIAITTAGKENNPQCVNIDCDENGSSSANISQTASPEPLVEDNVPLTEDTLETEDDHTNDDIETKEKETFSWQKANQICLDDEDEMFENTVATESKTNVGLDLKYWKSKEKKSDKEHINHKEYICNNCCKSIDGFRYTCLECENYDLCRDCETDMTHPEHCMLRIPEPRPKGEIQSILEAIREKMRSISEELGQNMIALDEVKVEVDFDDPTAMDPLTSPQSGAQLEAADVICDILKSDVTSPDETTNEATSDKITKKSSGKAPSVARQKAMPHSKPPERRSDTSLQPQTVRATKTPINRPKKLKLTTDFDGNNSKGPLKRIKLEKNQDFDQESLNPGHLEIKLENKDLEQESLNPKVHMKRIKLSRQVEENFEQECLEETWLDEDILKEENKLFDVSETSVSHTRSSAQPGPS